MQNEASFIAQELAALDKAQTALATRIRTDLGVFLSVTFPEHVTAVETDVYDLVEKQPVGTRTERLLTKRFLMDVYTLRTSIEQISFWKHLIAQLSRDLSMEIDRKAATPQKVSLPIPELYRMRYTAPELHVKVENYQIEVFASMCLNLEPVTPQ